MSGRADDSTLLVLVDEGGTVEWAEGAALQLFGQVSSQVSGQPVTDVWREWPDLVNGVREAANGRAAAADIKVDGTRIRLRFEPRGTASGRALGVMVQGGPSAHEVPDRSRGLSLLFRQIPCAVWSTDRDLRITHAMGHRRAWEHNRDAVVGSMVPDLVGGGDDDPMIRAHRAALDGEATALRYTFGGRVYESQVEPLRGPRDEIEGVVAIAVDVTERYATEENLARSEARLAEAQRIAHVGSWEWETATNKVRWTDEMYSIYGLAPAAFPGTYEAFLEHVLPEDRETTRTVVFDAYRNGQPFRYDHRIVRPDGSVRMLHTRGDVFADSHGKVLRLAGACWDITDLWESRRALERSLSLLTATLESTADGLLVVDRAHHVVTHNQRLLELWKVSRSAVESMTFDDLLDLVHGQLENATECTQRVQEMDKHPDAESFDSLQFKDGRFYERYSLPQRVGDEIIGRVWSYREVTERERLLRSAVFLADAGRLLASLEIEPALEAMGRLALESLADAVSIDILDGAEPRRLILLSHGARDGVGDELPRATRDGQPAIFTVGATSCMTVPLRARGQVLGGLSFAARSEHRFGPQDLALAGDLAIRVSLAIENARLYQRAINALAARDEFLSVAAHEIRGPLTSLRLAVQMLMKEPRLTESARLLSIIEREEHLLSHFVDELLDVARIRGGEIDYIYGSVDLVEVVHEVQHRLASELQRSGSALTLTAPSHLVGMWDRARLEQVALNLMGNAIKFGLGRAIDVRVECEGLTALLVVRDHGLGIPPDMRERIFQPFERAVSARHYGGLGLGLFIVQTIVKGLGGKVEVESEPGLGSVFKVTLPLTQPRRGAPA
jgi:signal transduction histidine kinase